MARPLHAEPVTLQFFGTMNSVEATVAHAIAIGDPFELTWTFDPAETIPSCCAPIFNSYLLTVTISGSIAGYQIDSFQARTSVDSSFSGGSRMIFEFDEGASHLPGMLLPGDWGLRALSFFYTDALTPGGQLPIGVNPGASMEFGAFYTQLDPNGAVPFSLGSFGSTTSIHSVPEPATAWLVASGALIGVGRLRSLRSRHSRRTDS